MTLGVLTMATVVEVVTMVTVDTFAKVVWCCESSYTNYSIDLVDGSDSADQSVDS